MVIKELDDLKRLCVADKKSSFLLFRWAMPFQSYVQLTMLDNHLHQSAKPVKLMERSIFSARYCFVENMHK